MCKYLLNFTEYLSIFSEYSNNLELFELFVISKFVIHIMLERVNNFTTAKVNDEMREREMVTLASVIYSMLKTEWHVTQFLIPVECRIIRRNTVELNILLWNTRKNFRTHLQSIEYSMTCCNLKIQNYSSDFKFQNTNRITQNVKISKLYNSIF